MDFNLTEEQKQFQEVVKGFAERHLAKDALMRAHIDKFPLDVAKLMASQGLMGITLSEEYGGQGGTLMDAVLAIETIAKVCPRSADVLQVGNFGAIRVLAEFGNDIHKNKFLSGLVLDSHRHESW